MKNDADYYRQAFICGTLRWTPLSSPRTTDNCFQFYFRLRAWRTTSVIEFSCTSDDEVHPLIGCINAQSITAAYVELHEGGTGTLIYKPREGGCTKLEVKPSTEFEAFTLFGSAPTKEKAASDPSPSPAEDCPDLTDFARQVREKLGRGKDGPQILE